MCDHPSWDTFFENEENAVIRLVGDVLVKQTWTRSELFLWGEAVIHENPKNSPLQDLNYSKLAPFLLEYESLFFLTINSGWESLCAVGSWRIYSRLNQDGPNSTIYLKKKKTKKKREKWGDLIMKLEVRSNVRKEGHAWKIKTLFPSW